jgi:hypothetical protein
MIKPIPSTNHPFPFVSLRVTDLATPDTEGESHASGEAFHLDRAATTGSLSSRRLGSGANLTSAPAAALKLDRGL